MTPKSLKPGDTVFILVMHKGYNMKPSIRQEVVKKIGRIYATLDDTYGSRFMVPVSGETDYLIQQVDTGERELLFCSRADAERHVEHDDLVRRITTLPHSVLERCSLEQLRQAADALGLRRGGEQV